MIFPIFAKQKDRNMNNFNPYIKHINTDAMKDLCVRHGRLKGIASYLMITPTHMSRIRRKQSFG